MVAVCLLLWFPQDGYLSADDIRMSRLAEYTNWQNQEKSSILGCN